MSGRRSFVRKSGIRDARLIVIACEGAVTEPKYFEAIRSRFIHHPARVHIEIVERPKNNSAPEYVLEALDDFSREYSLNEYDELWIVIDYDRWGEKKLSRESAKAVQKNYSMAVSRPCFEVWLLLHFIDAEGLTERDLVDLDENGCKSAKLMLNKFLEQKPAGVRKVDVYMPKVRHAIEEAQKLDTNPDHRWPNSVGSRVYRLMESILS